MRKSFAFAMLFSAALAVTVIMPVVAAAQTIVITQPKTLKVESSPVVVKGAVMDFDVKEIELATVNLLELARSAESAPSARRKKTRGASWLDALDFETVPVRNSMFQKSVTIKEGIYSIIAKLPGAKPSPENLEIKVMVLDKTHDNIVLSEPKSDRAFALRRVAGRIPRGPSPKSVKIVVEALVADDGGYRLDKLVELSAPVRGRAFSVPVSIEEMLTGDEIVIITISTDGIAATMTLF